MLFKLVFVLFNVVLNFHDLGLLLNTIFFCFGNLDFLTFALFFKANALLPLDSDLLLHLVNISDKLLLLLLVLVGRREDPVLLATEFFFLRSVGLDLLVLDFLLLLEIFVLLLDFVEGALFFELVRLVFACFKLFNFDLEELNAAFLLFELELAALHLGLLVFNLLL